MDWSSWREFLRELKEFQWVKFESNTHKEWLCPHTFMNFCFQTDMISACNLFLNKTNINRESDTGF